MKRSERNRGAAMVIVLCVMVVFLALSATILLAGSVTLNTARNNVIFERSKVQAASLSELFVKELENQDINSSALIRHVRDQIMGEGWSAYDEDAFLEENKKSGALKTYTMDKDDSTHQRIRIEMYWIWESDPTESDPTEDMDPIDETTLSDKGVRLFVDVISTLNDMEYHVKREFELTRSDSANPDSEKKVDYPYLWNWSAMGRSSDRP